MPCSAQPNLRKPKPRSSHTNAPRRGSSSTTTNDTGSEIRESSQKQMAPANCINVKNTRSKHLQRARVDSMGPTETPAAKLLAFDLADPPIKSEPLSPTFSAYERDEESDGVSCEASAPSSRTGGQATKERKKFKNRNAAIQYRNRKREQTGVLRDKEKLLYEKNCALKAQIADLSEQRIQLKNMLLGHSRCGNRAVDYYHDRCAFSVGGLGKAAITNSEAARLAAQQTLGLPDGVTLSEEQLSNIVEDQLPSPTSSCSSIHTITNTSQWAPTLTDCTSQNGSCSTLSTPMTTFNTTPTQEMWERGEAEMRSKTTFPPTYSTAMDLSEPDIVTQPCQVPNPSFLLRSSASHVEPNKLCYGDQPFADNWLLDAGSVLEPDLRDLDFTDDAWGQLVNSPENFGL